MEAAQKAGLPPGLTPEEYLALYSQQSNQNYKSRAELLDHFSFVINQKVLPRVSQIFEDKLLGRMLTNFQVKQREGTIGLYVKA